MIKKAIIQASLGILLINIPSFSFAQPSIKKFDAKQESYFEFLADDMEYDNVKITGKGNVSVINLDYFVRADKAIFDTKTNELVLLGNVNAYKGNSLYLKSNEVKIKLKEDYSFLEPFYLQDSQSGLWVSAKSAEFDKNVYKSEDSIVSTCSVNNPIWQIRASRGEYNANDEWLKVWNPKLCIYEIPVLYLPYLSFSLGYKRKTGLLYPELGNSKDDGILYTQPIFIAPYSWWDMTLLPSLRTKRGAGLFSELRILDDKNQMILANFGGFFDTKSYQKEHNLENKNHYGIQLEYERSNLLTKYSDFFYEDGLYLDISQISDIDYFKLQKDEVEDRADLQGSLLTSRFNYFLKSESDYIGLYARYYNDLEYTSNAKTMQTLPQVQYHRHLESLFVPNLRYSFDYQAKNHTRASGYRAVQQEASLPLTYSMNLFDDYVNASASSVFYGTTIDYTNTKEVRLRNGRYYNNYYVFKLNSDLAKRYENFGHTISLLGEFTLPGIKNSKGDFTTFLTLPGDNKKLKLGISQSFYDNENILRLSHKMNQNFYFDKNLEQYGELENDLQYFYDYHLSFLSNIFYSHKEGKISEATHQIRYDETYFSAYFGHFMREKFAKVDIAQGRFAEANYLKSGFKKSFENFNLYAEIGYDYKERYMKTWQVGIDTSIRCFSFGVKYVNEVYPTLTSRGAEAKDDEYVMLTIKFIPLLSSDVKVGR